MKVLCICVVGSYKRESEGFSSKFDVFRSDLGFFPLVCLCHRDCAWALWLCLCIRSRVLVHTLEGLRAAEELWENTAYLRRNACFAASCRV